MVAHVHPSTLSGTISVPPSKSMAHRLLICSALSRGVSRVSNLDYSQDILVTIEAMRQLGANIVRQPHSAAVQGASSGFATPSRPIDCGESGSSLRFLIPLFGLLRRPVTLTGAKRLFQRPLDAYEQIFTGQGLTFSTKENNLTIKGPLRSGTYKLAGNVSSQFISGLLFALPLLPAGSTIAVTPPFESHSYVELTRSAQRMFGVISEWVDAFTLYIPGGQHYRATNGEVEGDWSQCIVPAALAAIKGELAIEGLSPTSAQGDKVLLSILERCGAVTNWESDGTLRIYPPEDGLISPGYIDMADCPDLGPVLCSLALFCKGTTRLENASRLRIKESDRIATMETELKKLGGRITSTEDSITIQGGSPLRSGQTIDSHNDHRVVMAGAVAALGAGIELTINGADAVRKSWPGFFNDLQIIGAEVTLDD